MTKPSPATAERAPRPRGPYREPTTPIRVPRSLLGDVQALLAAHRRKAQTKGAASCGA